MDKAVVLFEETDGSPSRWAWKLKFPAGSLTDNGDGTVSYNGAGTVTADLVVGSETTGKNISAIATLGTEKITWTAAGWDEGGVEWTVAGTPIVITHATGNTTALTSTLASAIVAGVTYKVVIVYTQVAGSCTYTLGGVTGTALSTTGETITDYITASTAVQMIITPLTTSNIVISSISIKALTDATGDLTVDGNIYPKSQILGPYSGYASPAYSFRGDPDSGLYMRGPNELALVTGGGSSNIIRFDGATLSMDNGSAALSFFWKGVILTSDGGSILAQRSSTSAQVFRVYNTYTSTTNNERMSFDWQTLANVPLIKISKGSAGGTQREVLGIMTEDNGQYLGIKTATTLLTIAAGGLTSTWSNGIPANSIVFGITATVTVSIPANATNFDVGVGGALTRYIENYSGTAGAGSPGIGVAGSTPLVYTSATDVIVTTDANPGTNAGRIRLTVHYIDLTPATS